jgi:hypothetical protein
MTDKKIILEELGRIRELMGFNDNSTLNINEAVAPGGPGRGIFDDVIPGGSKTFDNLTALGKTYDDLFTYSRRMSNLVPSKNIDDFIDLVGRQNNNPAIVTPQMIKAFIANDSLLTKELMETAAKIAEERVAMLMSNVNFTKAFNDAGFPNVPSKINDTLKTPVDDVDIPTINQGLDLAENIINNVPALKNSLEGKEFLEQIAGKRQQIKDFEDLKNIKNTSPSPNPAPNPVPNPAPYPSPAPLNINTSNLLKDELDIIFNRPGIKENVAQDQLDRIRNVMEAKYGSTPIDELNLNGMRREAADRIDDEIRAAQKEEQRLRSEGRTEEADEAAKKTEMLRKAGNIVKGILGWCVGKSPKGGVGGKLKTGVKFGLCGITAAMIYGTIMTIGSATTGGDYRFTDTLCAIPKFIFRGYEDSWISEWCPTSPEENATETENETTITEDETLKIIGKLTRDYPGFDARGFQITRVLLRDPDTNEPTSIEWSHPTGNPPNGTMTFDKTTNKWI